MQKLDDIPSPSVMGFNHPFSYEFKTWIQDSHVFNWITTNQIQCFDHGTYGDGSRWSGSPVPLKCSHQTSFWTYGCKRYWSISHHKSKLFERCFRIFPWNVCIGIDPQAQLWNADGMYIHCLTGATNNPFDEHMIGI